MEEVYLTKELFVGYVSMVLLETSIGDPANILKVVFHYRRI